MDEGRQTRPFEKEVHDYAERHAFLLGSLENGQVSVQSTRGKDGVDVLDVVVSGNSAFRLDAVRTRGSAADPALPTGLFRDDDLDDRFDPAKDPLEAEASGEKDREFQTSAALLESAVRMAARLPGRPNLGPVALESSPRRYRFFLRNAPLPRTGEEGSDSRLEIDAGDAVSGRQHRAVPGSGDWTDASEDPGSPAGEPPRFEAGRVGPHPWLLPAPGVAGERIGPGEVLVDTTRVFGEGQAVRIEAGTRFRLGPGVSLVFRGKVTAAGTARDPIDVVRKDPSAPFGGVALQGPGTAGSELRHVRVRGGSVPSWAGVHFPATVCVHDTRDIVLSGCSVSASLAPNDLLHAAYVSGLAIEDCRFLQAGADALDLEFTQARISGTWAVKAGPTDEALDLMASTVVARDCAFAGAGGNAVSVGEKSEVRLHDCLLAHSRTGALVKSRSDLVLRDCLLYRVRSGVRLHAKSPKYGGRSRAVADVLFAMECPEPLWVDDGSPGDISRVENRRPKDRLDANTLWTIIRDAAEYPEGDLTEALEYSMWKSGALPD
jgi:hypothetical protein